MMTYEHTSNMDALKKYVFRRLPFLVDLNPNLALKTPIVLSE